MNIMNKFTKVNTFVSEKLSFLNIAPIVQIVNLLVFVVIVLNINTLPDSIVKGLLNPATAAVSFFLFSFNITHNLALSAIVSGVIVGVAFGLKTLFDKFESFDLIYPSPDLFPGCMKVKVSDLLTLFKGDNNKLKQVMYESGVPLSIELNDTNAGLIATYLINKNYKVTTDCSM